MADRLRYLLTYDIRDPRRLTRIRDVAKAFGEPLQYSVFVCDLSKAELVRMRAGLRSKMDLRVDSVSIFDLGPPTGRGLTCIESLGPRAPLPSSGAQVW